MKKDTIIVFDVGCVQIKLDFSTFFNDLENISGIPKEEIITKYKDSKLEYHLLRGDINACVYCSNLSRLLNLKNPLNEDDLTCLMRNFFTSDIPEMIKLKKKLHKKGYSIGILSNTFKLAKDLVDKTYPEIFTAFDYNNPVILSHELNSIKPENKMYNMINRYEKVIFIDDNYNFVKKAQDIGWHSIQYTEHIDPLEPIRHINPQSNSNNLPIAKNLSEIIEFLEKNKIYI